MTPSLPNTDPEKQFLFLIDFISRIRVFPEWHSSRILVFVESNLGFESEHHERALRGVAGITFYRDTKRARVGVITTLPIKHAAVTLFNSLLMERRVSLAPTGRFISKDEMTNKVSCVSKIITKIKLTSTLPNQAKLKDQCFTYSYQFKESASIFGKGQIALSGKVGGMKDDVCLSLQLCVYHVSKLESMAEG